MRGAGGGIEKAGKAGQTTKACFLRINSFINIGYIKMKRIRGYNVS